MIIIKYLCLSFLFICSYYMGILVSNKYKNRVLELRRFKEIVNIIQNKIRFTYKPLGEIFEDIINLYNKPNYLINIFEDTIINMKSEDVNTSWEKAIKNHKMQLSLNEEDISIIKGLGKNLR